MAERNREELRCDAERSLDKSDLANDIVLGYPADLTFVDCVHRLVTFNRSPCTFCRPKTRARHDPLLDKAMVLLDDVVQIRRDSAMTAPAEFTPLLQLGDRTGICRVAIHIDYTRRGTSAGQCQAQEQLRRNQVALGRQHELDRLAG